MGKTFYGMNGNKPLKDKRSEQYNMKDLLHEMKQDEQFKGTKKSSIITGTSLIGGGNSELAQKEEKYREEYNEGIHKLDKDYASLELTGYQILVRVFAKCTKRDSGIIVLNNTKVPLATRNGNGVLRYIESPYPFSHKAIVVAVCKSLESSYEVGDIIQLRTLGLICPNPGEDLIIPQYSFTRYEYEDEYLEPPRSAGDKHFGYMLIDNNNVACKLDNIKTEIN